MIIRKPDGEILNADEGATLKEILVETDKSLLKTCIGARLGGERIDFHTQLAADAEVELIAWEAEEAAEGWEEVDGA